MRLVGRRSNTKDTKDTKKCVGPILCVLGVLGVQSTLATLAKMVPAAGKAGAPSSLDILVLGRREEDLPALEAAVLGVIDDLRSGRVKADALDRGRTALRVEWASTANDRKELARELGQFQVKEAATTYLDPGAMTTVVVGPIANIRQARHPRWPATLEELGFQP